MKGIQLDIPPEYANYANMRDKEKMRPMIKTPSQGYPQGPPQRSKLLT